MPANARPLPVDAPDVDVALATVITDLNSALTALTSILSATDQLEGYSDTIEPKLQSLIDALAGTLSVETSAVIGWTYFTTSDARYGLSETYTEWRASDGKTRTVTLTRDTSTGALTGSDADTATWA